MRFLFVYLVLKQNAGGLRRQQQLLRATTQMKAAIKRKEEKEKKQRHAYESMQACTVLQKQTKENGKSKGKEGDHHNIMSKFEVKRQWQVP